MNDATIRRVRDALGPGRTSDAPPAALWERVAAATELPPRRQFREWRFAAVGLAAAFLLAVGLLVRRRSAEPYSTSAVRVATLASLQSIDAQLAKLRGDSASDPRVEEEMLFLARMRAAVQSNFQQGRP